MRICFLADSESIHTKRWCAHFHALGHEIHLISLKNSPIDNVHFYHLDAGDISVKGGNKKVLFQGGKVRRLIKKIKPDILHAHYATSYGWLGARSNFHPFLVTALGTDILISPIHSSFYRKMVRYIFKKADAITLMAEHMKKVIIDYNLGDLNKFIIVPFGIDTEIFHSNYRKVDEEFFVITSTRNFEDVYNIPHLLKSIAKVKDKIPGLKLNLIGDGSKRKMIEEIVKDLGLSDCTHFFGKISQPEIANILKNSHVFVTVSLSDGNNISLNEAMACGPICVATDIPANIQWINDTENGFLVKVNDVEKLSDILLNIRNNFEGIFEKFYSINQSIISDKADWNKNMKLVEHKYNELCKK